MNGESTKGLLKWLAITVVIVMVCTALILYVNDLSSKTTELRVEQRIAKITTDIFTKNQSALDKLAEVTLKTYQTEIARMATEIKLLREEIVSLKQELRECVGTRKEKP